jgi:hypothetical protein
MSDSWCPNTYGAVLDELRRRLALEPDYRVQLLSGPRQVGKTTLLLELARDQPGSAIYAAADAPAAGGATGSTSRAVVADAATHCKPAHAILSLLLRISTGFRRDEGMFAAAAG